MTKQPPERPHKKANLAAFLQFRDQIRNSQLNDFILDDNTKVILKYTDLELLAIVYLINKHSFNSVKNKIYKVRNALKKAQDRGDDLSGELTAEYINSLFRCEESPYL